MTLRDETIDMEITWYETSEKDVYKVRIGTSKIDNVSYASRRGMTLEMKNEDVFDLKDFSNSIEGLRDWGTEGLTNWETTD